MKLRKLKSFFIRHYDTNEVEKREKSTRTHAIHYSRKQIDVSENFNVRKEP